MEVTKGRSRSHHRVKAGTRRSSGTHLPTIHVALPASRETKFSLALTHATRTQTRDTRLGVARHMKQDELTLTDGQSEQPGWQGEGCARSARHQCAQQPPNPVMVSTGTPGTVICRISAELLIGFTWFERSNVPTIN